MIIYLEGVDGSGKSTLAAAIAKALEETKIKYVTHAEDLIPTNPNSPNRISRDKLEEQLYLMAKDLDTIYICDRGPLSDIIYRTFDDFDPVINLHGFMWLYSQSHFGIEIVYCDTAKSEELMLKRGDLNPVALTKHKELKYLYSQLLPEFWPITYDLEKDNIDNKIDAILSKMFLHRRLQESIKYV